ncbi:MAG TPA: hypothetical protein VNS22_14595, partial [Geminicoccus sp.]|uniref:hypothetical protein n=1 Tax=Geminicoccus sp. TaxID=2024832 RepID=UPI002BC1B12C
EKISILRRGEFFHHLKFPPCMTVDHSVGGPNDAAGSMVLCAPLWRRAVEHTGSRARQLYQFYQISQLFHFLQRPLSCRPARNCRRQALR